MATLRTRLMISVTLGVLLLVTHQVSADRGVAFDLVSVFDPDPASVAEHFRYSDVWAEGDYAYLGSFESTGVKIIDISNPANPFLAATYDPGFVLQDVKVHNGVGYFANDGGGGVHIVNLSDPTSPSRYSTITPAQNGHTGSHNIFVANNLLYEVPLGAEGSDVKVFDVSDPANPTFVRDITTNDNRIHDITVVGSRLYTSGLDGTTNIFDVSSMSATTAPTPLGTVFTGLNTHSNWASPDGSLLISSTEVNNGKVTLWDISNPSSAVFLSEITNASLALGPYADEFSVTPHNPFLVGNKLYISWLRAGLQVMDVSDPSDPVATGFYAVPPHVEAGHATSSTRCHECNNAVHSAGGVWGVYPLLGRNKILLSDLDDGLYIVSDSTLTTGSINSAITKDTTLYSHEDPTCCEDYNFGGYDQIDPDPTDHDHTVLGFDNRLVGGVSTEDNARPVLKAGDIVTDLLNAGVTASSEIVSAELHLFRVQPETFDRTGRAYRLVRGDWVEGTGEFDIVDDATTWNNVIHDEVPWTTPGGDFDLAELGSFTTTTNDPTHTEYTVPITDAVQHWFDNASENFGVIVLRDSEDDNSTAFFASREDTVDSSAYVPFISVSFAIPPPPATEFTWNTTNFGDWADSGNWTFSTGGRPNPDIRANGPDHTAIFADAISGPTNVSTHAAVTVNRIEFNNTAHSYAVAGLGSVNLAATTTTVPVSPSVSATGTHQFQAVVNLLANTSIDVASDSTLSFNNALDLMGNTLTKTGEGALAINNKLTTAGGTVDVQQGTISGNGTIAGDVDNGGGTISPGNSPGVLVIEGDLTQGEGGSILIELSGTAAGSQYDTLRIDGHLSADGTLEVRLLDGFQPSLSDTFDILAFGSLSGGFDKVILPDLAGTLGWDDSSLLVDGSLSVVPEPATIIPLCLGLMIWLTYWRQKSAEITWPSSMAASRCQVTNSIVSLAKITCPSAKTAFTPPGCRLRAAA
jgi:choice-of-anchor B domain-containing protein